MSSISMHLATKPPRSPVAGVALAFVMIVAACGATPGAGSSGAPARSAAGGNPSVVGSTPVGGTHQAGGGQPAASSVGGAAGVPTDMCAVVSGQDVAVIVGKDLAETKPEGDWCTWDFTDKKAGSIKGIGGSVIVRYEDDDTTLGITKTAFPNGEDVSIGDGGYWTDGLSVLSVAKGGHVYDVQLILFDKADPRKEMAMKIAQLLLAKL